MFTVSSSKGGKGAQGNLQATMSVSWLEENEQYGVRLLCISQRTHNVPCLSLAQN